MDDRRAGRRQAANAAQMRAHRPGHDGRAAGEYAVRVGENQLTGRGPRIEPSGAEHQHGPIASTSCLVVVLLIVFVVLVVLPAALWLLGIACGGE